MKKSILMMKIYYKFGMKHLKLVVYLQNLEFILRL